MIKKSAPYFFITLGTILYFLIFSNPIKRMDNIFTDLQFEYRQESKIDSNIITLYIDKDIMDSLGRIPLRWNYFTRTINGLSKFGAKAIGIDNIFDKNSPDYSTQSSWLVSAIRRSNRVCIGGFFDKIKDIPKYDTIKIPIDSTRQISVVNSNDSSKIPSGDELDLPFSWLLKNAAGFGHLNFTEETKIRKVPLVLSNVDSSHSSTKYGEIIPALSLELLRVYFHLPKDSIIIKEDELQILNGEKTIKIPTANSQMLINYCGGINSLNLVSFSDFLKMLKQNNNGRDIFNNKIVLIGFIGKRTSGVETTPFGNKFPPIGIQANIIDTILRQRFLHPFSAEINIIISILISSLVFWFITKRKFNFQKSVMFSASFIIFYLLLSFLLFKANVILSFQPIIILTATIFAAGIYEFNLLQSDSKKIEKEKHSVEFILNKSRQKILHLEESINKLTDSSIKSDSMELVRDYNSELSSLTQKFGDLSEYNKNNQTENLSFGENIVFSKNSKMEKLVEFANKIAPTEASVLILGESGTGKELMAHAIHNLSERKNENFITINCGAIPDTLLESELFGHEEGAYTGAKKQHKGYFEIADKGTIFLDEITETNELFQVKLLRVLQSGEFNRVGGTDKITVDVRVIAASNKKIEQLVDEKKFREDLYYRLNVIKISIPPLRERNNDIYSLTKRFLEKEDAEKLNISNSVMQAFLNYNWPGNIRQLENTLKRAVILAKADNSSMVQLSHLPNEIITSLKKIIDMEGLIIEKIRQKEFSYSAITETADEIGGLHRGTISEYLKGYCFKKLCENEFNFNKTVSEIANTENDDIIKRVHLKLEEYLSNLFKKVADKKPDNDLVNDFKHIFKKLPNKYYDYIEKIIYNYYDKETGSYSFERSRNA